MTLSIAARSRAAATVLVMAALLVLAPATASAASQISTPFSGTATLANGARIPVVGTFNITSFATNAAGQLVANGTLNFVANGAAQVAQATAQVTNASGSCTVLSLTIGAINLDLLGLKITTNVINLDITAQPGGGLLGNLLCSIANLLSGGFTSGILGQLSTLLNQVIAAL